MLACSNEAVTDDILTQDIKTTTAAKQGLTDGTKGVNCDAFILPPADQFFNLYPTQEEVSILEFRTRQIENNVYFRFYPKNGKFQEFLACINLTSTTIYGVHDADGNLLDPYWSNGDIFRIRVVGINGTNYDQTFCFNPTSYVSAIYTKGKQNFPDVGEFEVEFLDYTQFGVGKKYFKIPSF